MCGNNGEGIAELFPSGPALQCPSLPVGDSHLEVAQAVPGTVGCPYGRCSARSVLGGRRSQEATRGCLLPRGTVESSAPRRGAQDVTVTLEDGAGWRATSVPVPSSEGHAREQGPPVCWCRAAAPGLFGVGEWGPREGRCPWWVRVTAPCPSALAGFGQHRCVSAASVLESLTGSLRGSAQHRAGSCPGKPRAPGSAKIMLAAGADLGMPGRRCHCQSRQRG